MPSIHPLGANWADKFSFKYSPTQEMLWSLHVLADASHHQDILNWSLQVSKGLSPRLASGIQYMADNFEEWGVFIELVEALEGDKILTWDRVETELTQMGQALFVYFALGRTVKVGELLKVVRQPALIEHFLRTYRGGLEKEALRAILLDPERIRTKLVETLREYWSQHFGAEIQRAEEYYFNSLQAKIKALQDMGPTKLLDELGLGVYLVDGLLTGEALAGEEIEQVQLAVRDIDRIVVMPTIFASPHLLPQIKDKWLYLRYPIPYPQPSARRLESEELLGVMKALADGTRLRILAMLMTEPLYTGEIAGHLGFSEPTVSRHMKQLKTAGLVTARKEENYVYYTLDRGTLEVLGTELSRHLQEDYD